MGEGVCVCQNLYFLNIILLYNTDAFTLHTYILFRVLNDVNALYMTCIIYCWLMTLPIKKKKKNVLR